MGKWGKKCKKEEEKTKFPHLRQEEGEGIPPPPGLVEAGTLSPSLCALIEIDVNSLSEN